MRRILLSLGLLALACDLPAPPPPRSLAPGPKPAPERQPAPNRQPQEAPEPEDPMALRELAGLQYLEIIVGGAERSAELPMVIAIHGMGDSPHNFEPLFAQLRTPCRLIVPRGLDPFEWEGKTYWSWYPMRAKSPDQQAVVEALRRASDALATFTESIVAKRPTRGRPLVTGFSQGGMLSFTLAVDHPGLFAAAFPIGGWLTELQWPTTVPANATPILAFHGEADSIMPLEATRESVEALKKIGWPVQLRTFPGVDHIIPQSMRAVVTETLNAALKNQADNGLPSPG